MAQPWNHSTHFHQRLLRLLPPGRSALDVGCGDGSFAALLARRYEHVLALDVDASQVAATQERCRHLPNVEVRQGNFATAPLARGAFDVVTALASFHHRPLERAAAAVDQVLAPGGRLVVLGVWTGRASASDLPWNAASWALHKCLRLVRGPTAMTSPAVLSDTCWSRTRDIVDDHFPGARMRRHLLWRYTLVWDEPEDDPART